MTSSAPVAEDAAAEPSIPRAAVPALAVAAFASGLSLRLTDA